MTLKWQTITLTPLLSNQTHLLSFIFSFIMFALLLILLTISWVLTLISRIEYDGMFYINLTISAIQAPLVLYICVLRQKHVTYLLQKACCSKQPLSGADWGDEMTYINTANQWKNGLKKGEKISWVRMSEKKKWNEICKL